MNDPIDDVKAGSRRDFLLGAGIAAGGVTLLGGNTARAFQDPATKAQEPKPAAPSHGAEHPNPRIRASLPVDKRLSKLGPLRELGGTWVGRGFNVMSLPDFENPAGPEPFRVKVNATRETLEFTPIGAQVPNRGSTGQDDISIFGFSYFQRISDAFTSSALHVEPGFWLNLPETTVPPLGPMIVRQGSIPHGTSVMAIGAPTNPIVLPGGPKFAVVSTTPIQNPVDPTHPITPAYLSRFSAVALPPGFSPEFLENPNLALETAIVGLDITETVVLSVSTKPKGIDPLLFPTGVLNIPFTTKNASFTQLDAIFWIEKVLQSDGTHFMQLQYTQTILLHFLGIDWPHISVATLVKQ